MTKPYNNAISHKLINTICYGRLTLESGVPISTTDQTAKTTLYFTPYNGNSISLYDGSEWDLFSFSELSLSLSGYTANTNYDIFIYDNSGTLTLESTAWTNDTTRATSLTTQDGIYVKSGAITRRYLGTIRITGTTGQCEDSLTSRFIWNMYNKKDRQVRRYGPGMWTYGTNVWRVFAGAAASSYDIRVVNGLVEDLLLVDVGALVAFPGSAVTYYYIAMAQDSPVSPITSTNRKIERVGGGYDATQHQLASRFEHIVPLGYHYYYPIELRESGTVVTLFAGDVGSYWGGILGTWRC